MKPKALVETFVEEGAEANTRHLIIGSDADDMPQALRREMRAALNRGNLVRTADGKRVWRARRPVENPGRTGSSRYNWHEDGNRVQARTVEVTIHPDGRREERQIRTGWIRFEDI